MLTSWHSTFSDFVALKRIMCNVASLPEMPFWGVLDNSWHVHLFKIKMSTIMFVIIFFVSEKSLRQIKEVNEN